ncbi:MAG TPA: hypothetical protein GXX75_00725 [Clostridiales bacterium]|nr:hypothetical protein [Clostridiales bacterium]
MKSFEKELKRRIYWQALYAIFAGLTVIIAFIIKIRLYSNTEPGNDWETGVLIGLASGFFFGTEIPALCRILQYRKALRNPGILEALHIKETDERNRMIALKACQSCLNFVFALLGIAGIVTVFLNTTIFLTIGVILIALLILYIALHAYYSWKY